MTSVWRGLRRRILTPSTSATRLDVRGFHEKDAASKELLEKIGSTFLTGFAHAAQARTADEAESELERIPVRFRGFAYEGAAMGFAIRDALPLSRGGNIPRFLAGAGGAHVYMAYVGIGWAMARLPRARWSRIAPTDPVLRWLALDGYGFHQAYFHTGRYVHQRYRPERFPWPVEGPRWYADRVLDQGVGRALWFVCGTAPALVVRTIETFPRHRWPDLYSGAGLAATYAGGADESELRSLWDAAGDCRPQLAQGAAFAAAARLRAGLVVPHNEVATRVFCGMSTAEAARCSDGNRPEGPVRGDVPGYEVWRRRVAHEFVSIGRC
ncbi:DUF1702 family protein [Plantactinospora sp. B6F1]|uniref:DUF1702 family protein n=1 Tax=Plantactinospora sp. B6F1 TaxID=3158971 RepID=UPI0032D9ABA4